MAAFASEVGTSVIAEGVETEPSSKCIREAEVDLVQGYLLARPGPPWPSLVPDTPARQSGEGSRREGTDDGRGQTGRQLEPGPRRQAGVLGGGRASLSPGTDHAQRVFEASP